jgi:SAM-dependent methyltransferase
VTVIYTRGFAPFYDRYGTGWTRQFAPQLADWLSTGPAPAGKHLLDLACGTGVASRAFLDAGWTVSGVDVSEAMLTAARHNLAEELARGQATLHQADMTMLKLDHQVSACVALEGALNHLLSLAALEECFHRVAASLPVSGTFVFDLYEPHHFRGWHNMSVIDEPGAMVVKHGVWDDDRAVGMLRIAGHHDDGSGPVRIEQTFTSLAFPPETVDALLAGAGFKTGRFPGTVPPCACGRSSTGSCRTVYAATRSA